ncbi:MAG: sugar transferase [Lachnospiraceae bacterium]|nr:sugar transferase [Lachnospiraceae bacterium]MBD5483078.1 sugar transferase [Lachnospiraceae bacterium]
MGRKERQTDVFEMYVLLIADILCLFLSYLLGLYLRFHSVSRIDEPNLHWNVFWGILVFSILYDSAVDYNRNFTKRGYYVEAKAIIKRNAIMAAGIGVVLFSFKQAENYSRLVYGYFMAADTLFTYGTHVALKRYLRARLRKERHKVKIMVITDRVNAPGLMDKLLKKAELYWDITSIAVMDGFEEETINEIPVVADGNDLLDVAKQMPIDEIFLYLPEASRKQVDQIIMDFETMGVVCHYNIDVAGLSTKNSTVEEFGGFTVITYAENRIDYKRRMIKRLIDIAGSLVGLLITVVLLPFVAIAIKLDSKGPVFFAQTRIGKNGRRFKIYKFRSMYVDAEARKKELEAQNEVQGLMFKMENDPRITKVGHFLRKTSIDELPQFYNILIGDMSLVGTRPPTEDEFEQYTPYYRRRLCMTPGLTGLWQVSGRSDVQNFDDVVKYDLHYIDYWSLSLDFKILVQTIGVVLFGRGAK